MTYFYDKIQIDCKYEVKMKSLLTSFIMFAVVCAALYSGVFNFMASPYMLAFAAGAMLYVVVEELIPEYSRGKHSNIGTIGFALGFALMMVLDVVLG